MKISLFRLYCTPVYTAHVWTYHRNHIACNGMMMITRLCLKSLRWLSAGEPFVAARVGSFEAAWRNLMHSFICRLSACDCEVMGFCMRFNSTGQSALWTHCCRCLCGDLALGLPPYWNTMVDTTEKTLILSCNNRSDEEEVVIFS